MYLDKYNLSVKKHKKLRQIARETPAMSSNGAEYSTEEPSKNDGSEPTRETPPKVLNASEQKSLVIKSLIAQVIEILPSYPFEQIVGFIKQQNQLITQWLEGEWDAFKTLRQLVVDLVRENRFIRQMLQEHLLKVLDDGSYVIDDDWDSGYV